MQHMGKGAPNEFHCRRAAKTGEWIDRGAHRATYAPTVELTRPKLIRMTVTLSIRAMHAVHQSAGLRMRCKDDMR